MEVISIQLKYENIYLTDENEKRSSLSGKKNPDNKNQLNISLELETRMMKVLGLRQRKQQSIQHKNLIND